VYSVSSLVVSLDFRENQQDHFRCHGAQEVLAVAASATGAVMASAAFEVEAGWDFERPRIRLWRASTTQ